jgi:hypothetical protein
MQQLTGAAVWAGASGPLGKLCVQNKTRRSFSGREVTGRELRSAHCRYPLDLPDLLDVRLCTWAHKILVRGETRVNMRLRLGSLKLSLKWHRQGKQVKGKQVKRQASTKVSR